MVLPCFCLPKSGVNGRCSVGGQKVLNFMLLKITYSIPLCTVTLIDFAD